MDIVLRAAIIYALVFVFTRAEGLSSLQPFDFILLVVIGDLIQSGLTQTDLWVTGVFLALCTIGILQVVTSYLGFRFRRARPSSKANRSCSWRTANSSTATCAASG
jgi:uncharacterized membrane protein YcaP (DUF421 family)